MYRNRTSDFYDFGKRLNNPSFIIGMHHRDQRDAVANAVVYARDHGRATVVALQQFKVPQRMAPVQRHHGQFGHPVLQCLTRTLPASALEMTAPHMVVDVKVAVAHPGGARRVFHHPLHKTRVLGQAYGQPLGQRIKIKPRFEHPHPHNHHQVGIAVHPQPGGIDTGDKFTG